MEVTDPMEATVAKGATVDTAAMLEAMEAMADTVDLDTETTTAMADTEGRVESSANLDTEVMEDMEEGTEATEMATERATATDTAAERGPTPATRAAVDTERAAVTTAV